MGAAEIVIIVVAALIVAVFTATYVIRRIKGKPTGSCSGCPYAKNCNHNCKSRKGEDVQNQ